MTRSFKDMMYLFSCSSHGIEPIIDHEIDIEKIYHLSMSQGVWCLVFSSLKKICNDDRIHLWNNQVIFNISNNIRRNYVVHSVLKKLEDSNIKYCLLKGESLATLYNNPDLRVSGDTDIYVDRDQEAIVGKILKDFGFKCESMTKASNHSIYVHNIAGTFEVHRNLYSEIAEDAYFNNMINLSEDYRSILFDDGSAAWTFGVTDGLVFTALHMIKHFLNGGVGIRQIMDTLLYMKYYKSEIDWNRFYEIINSLKFNKFLNYIKGIGIKYLLFDENDFYEFSCDDELLEKILCDIEGGGSFGYGEKLRANFYLAYAKERYNSLNRNESYLSYIKRFRIRQKFGLIFPNKNEYLKRYSYIRKYPYLLPIAWLNRIFDFIKALIKKEKNVKVYLNLSEINNNNDVIEKRMELIRKLDMI